MYETDVLERTVEVTCPHCGDPTGVPPPMDGIELKIRKSVAAFGDYQKVTCSQGHTYWVYYC